MREIAENLPITEGVGRMMQVLKRAGFKTAATFGRFHLLRQLSQAEVRI